jgi:hypothetical protein
MQKPARYLGIFALSAGLAGFLTPLINFGSAALSCRRAHAEGSYLAYCSAVGFTDYEHGAYYYALENEAVRNLQRADVVFLGSSRGQFAFSTDAVREFFRARGLSFHILGFGEAEQSPFVLELLRKFPISPKLLVVHVDPYFHTYMSKTAAKVIAGSPTTRIAYMYKQVVSRAHASWCSALTGVCSYRGAVYRSRMDGSWLWVDVLAPGTMTVPIRDERQPVPSDLIGFPDRLAGPFLDAVGVPRGCVVMTAAPHDLADFAPAARQIAMSQRAEVALPDIHGLATIDGAHLNKPSAERWSTEMLAIIAPIVERCTQGAPR